MKWDSEDFTPFNPKNKTAIWQNLFSPNRIQGCRLSLEIGWSRGKKSQSARMLRTKIPIPFLSLFLNSENEKVRIWARLFHGVARYEDHLLHLIHMGKENLVLLSSPLHHQNCCPQIQGQNYPQTPHKKLTSVRRWLMGTLDLGTRTPTPGCRVQKLQSYYSCSVPLPPLWNIF